MNINFQTELRNDYTELQINKLYLYIKSINVELPYYTTILFTLMYPFYMWNDGSIELDDEYERDNSLNSDVLIKASRIGFFDIVKYIIESGVSADIKDSGKITPLIGAVEGGYYDIAEYLVEKKKVNINAQDHDGWTALMYACLKGDKRMVEYLVSKKIKINIKTKLDDTAIDIAKRNGHIGIAEYLKDELNNQSGNGGI